MTLVALVSLAFSGWVGWTMYSSVKGEKLSDAADYISTIWLALGSGSGCWLAIRTLMQLWSPF